MRNKTEINELMQNLQQLIDKKPFKHIENINEFENEIKGYESDN